MIINNSVCINKFYAILIYKIYYIYTFIIYWRKFFFVLGICTGVVVAVYYYRGSSGQRTLRAKPVPFV